MAVMDASIFDALWRHTPQIKYAKPNYKVFSRILLLQIFLDVQFYWQAIISPTINQIYEKNNL